MADSKILTLPAIRAVLEEARELSREDYRPLEVTLRVTLNTTTTSDTDKFRAPAYNWAWRTSLRSGFVEDRSRAMSQAERNVEMSLFSTPAR